MVIFFDPFIIIIIILFVILGSIGLIKHYFTTILIITAVLFIATIVLFIFLDKYGFDGFERFFKFIFAILLCAFAIGLFVETPLYANLIAKHTTVVICEAIDECSLGSSVRTLSEGDIAVLTEKSGKNFTYIDIYGDKYTVGCALEESMDEILEKYPLVVCIETTDDIYNAISEDMYNGISIAEVQRLIQQYQNHLESDKHSSNARKYIDTMIGNTYSDTNGSIAYSAGDICERVVCTIIDESYLEYTYGTYEFTPGNNNGSLWVAMDIYEEGIYEYSIQTGLFGNAKIIINGEKYALEIDKSKKVCGIEFF